MSLADELLTGIQEIDEQHATLFDTLETLKNVVAAGDGWSAAYFARKRSINRVIASADEWV